MERYRHQQRPVYNNNNNNISSAMSPVSEFVAFVTQALGLVLEVAAHALLLLLNLLWALVDSFVEAALPTRKSFRGQAALVVGAGGGVGREAALLLGRRGARLVLWDSDTGAVRETARLVKAGGGEARHYTVDVTRRSEVEVAAHIASVDVQDVTLLVIPAPAPPPPEARLLDVPADEAAASLRRSLLSHVWLLQALLPQMRRAGAGHVVALLPAEAVRGAEGAALAAAHGGGVRALTEALRADAAALGRKADIRFTNVYALDAGAAAAGAARAMLEAAESNCKELSLPGALLPVADVARILPQPLVDLAKDVVFPPPERPPPPPRRRYVSEVEQLYTPRTLHTVTKQ